MTGKTFKIDDRQVGGGAPCYVIAEAGSNHDGDINQAFRLIDVAAEAKADAVKFQVFSAATIASPVDIPINRIDVAGAKSPFELFKGLEMPREWLADLFAYARDKGITFLATPFDEAAVDQLFDLGVSAFKVASFEINHFPMLARVAATGRPVLLSTGMADLGDVEEAMAVLESNGCSETALFHCGIGYPMDPAGVNLRAMQTLEQAFGCPVGYSDHTDGITVPVAAVAMGGKLIEKHFTVDRSLPGPDHPFALEPAELRDMVVAVRATEEAMGSPVKRAVESELEFKRRGRRSLFAGKPIAAGTVITRDMIKVLRPGVGLHPRHMETIVGSKATRDIGEHEPLSWDCFMLP